MLDTKGQDKANKILTRLGVFLLSKKITPNHVTLGALFLGILGGLTLGLRMIFLVPLSLLWLSGALDVLDGTMARLRGEKNHFGGILDLVCDRVVELAFILALGFIAPESLYSLLILTSTIVLGMSVFLASGAVITTKSKKIFYYQTGLVERTEGFVFLSLMIVFPQHISLVALIFAMGVFLTSIQRLFSVRQFLKEERLGSTVLALEEMEILKESIVARCTRCKKCMQVCPMLKDYGQDPRDILVNKGGTDNFDLKLPYDCLLCDECLAVCPERISLKEFFHQYRKNLALNNGGKIPLKGYRGVRVFQRLMFSSFFQSKKTKGDSDGKQ